VDFKLIWTDSAIYDLGAIVRYISSQSGPEVARKIGFEIYDTAQILKRFPEAGSILPEQDSARWRKLIVRSWKIAYKLDHDAKVAFIARVWHASRDEIEIE
jgi:plasmid stabilization system protein ParE